MNRYFLKHYFMQTPFNEKRKNRTNEYIRDVACA